MSRFAVFRSSRESRERERERESRESGTVTFHVYLFKCPGWKFIGKVWKFCELLLDDVTSWWMFEWKSGALARAQMSRRFLAANGVIVHRFALFSRVADWRWLSPWLSFLFLIQSFHLFYSRRKSNKIFCHKSSCVCSSRISVLGKFAPCMVSGTGNGAH